MSVVTGDILRIVASILRDDGTINQNVFNAEVTGAGGPWDDTDIVDDAEAWLDNMYANLTTLFSDDLAGNEVLVYKYDDVNDDWDEVGSQSWTWAPSDSTDHLPSGIAALVRCWTTDPDVQGKKYLAGMTDASVLSGNIGSGVLTSMLGFGADWITAFAGGTSAATWTPGIWSVAGLIFKAAVDHYAANGIPAYQRRRKLNVGI